MQSTIVLTYDQITRNMTTEPKREEYDCRVAAMARMVALMDCGCGFVVEHIPHDKCNVQPIRRVTLWDELTLG